MKRRSFTKGLAMLAGALLIPLDLVRAEDPPRDDLELFKRFFYVANGFAPNENQLEWFVDYKDGGYENFTSMRQTGMTTFMLTLALFETKRNGINVSIFPQCYDNSWRLSNRLNVMEDRLGKSVRDGSIYFYNNSDYIRGLSKSTKVFVTNDALKLPATWDWEIMKARQVFTFGTYERSDSGIVWAPYIPILKPHNI